MDSNPSSQTKSASRLARMSSEETQHLSLHLVSPSPKKAPSLSPSVPLQELQILSPSPMRKSRIRLTDRLEVADEVAFEVNGSRRRCKTRGGQMGLLGCGSPRNNRRSRRRSEMDMRDEREIAIGSVDEIAKVRKRRHSVRSTKEKLSLVSCVPSPSLSPKMDDGGEGNLDRIGQMLSDLIMWRDVAKSSLWFGLGCLCFLSSGFTKGVNFSIFSAFSQFGLLFLGASFFSNSILQRNNGEKRREFMLKEEDILRFSRLVLPATNLAISKTRELFSGEPSMTLKVVVPFLLLGAEYGHLITMWRLCAIGFFISFTVPKMYSCYSNQINQTVENTKYWLLEAWGSCSHKKIVASSAVMAFWNLSTIKTRIFTAFISLVILRCCRQHLLPKPEVEEAVEEEQEQQQQQALIPW